jgi:nitrite reductase/ring-hydroxylating ferredoxin subunit
LSSRVVTQRLGLIGDLPDGCARGFLPSGDGQTPVFVVRKGTRLYAYRDRCPHQAQRLAWRRDAYLNRAGDRIVCYGHGAEFEIASGQCVRGPCIGQSLEPVNLEVSAEGDIYLSEPTHG